MVESTEMRKNAPLLGAVSVLVLFAGLQESESAAGDTAHHFKILCRLAGIARAKIPKVELPTVDPDKIYKEAEKKFVSFGGQSENEKKENETGISLKDALKEAENKEKDFEFKSSAEVRKLAVILEKINATKEGTEKTKEKIAEKEKAIRVALAQAIFGKDATEENEFKSVNFGAEDAVSEIVADVNLAKKTISGDGAAAGCDGSPDTTHLAVSLVNDIYCICGGHSSTTDGTCYHGIQSGAAWGQLRGAVANDKHTTTKKLLDECAKVTGKVSLTPQAIQAALAAFFTKIGGGVGNDNGNYIFGKANTYDGTACSASQATTACVNYKAFLEKKDEKKQIPWVEKLQTAEEKLNERAELVRTLQNDAKRLESLADAVEIIQKPLGNAAPIGQISKTPNAQAAQQGKESSATASDPTATAMSIATIPSFILPWTLLI